MKKRHRIVAVLTGPHLALASFILLGWPWYQLATNVGPRPESETAGVLLAGVGASLGALTMFLLWGRIQDGRSATWINQARKGVPPRDGEMCAVIGEIHPAGTAPLAGPFTGVPTVFYEYEVTRQTLVSLKTRLVRAFQGMALAPCEIRTTHGPVRLLDLPSMLPFPEEEQKSAEALERARIFLEAAHFSDAVNPHTLGEVLDAAESRAKESVRETGAGRFDLRIANPHAHDLEEPMDLAKWTLVERSVPAGACVTATGKWSESRRGLAAGAGPSGMLLLSLLDPEEQLRRIRSGTGCLSNALGSLVLVQLCLAALVVLL